MAGTGPSLSTRALNRALLARQGLLGGERSIAAALEGMGHLQAQYAPSMYIGLFARGALRRREELTELLERDAVVQRTLLRSTIHLVTARDYWPVAMAVRRARREHWRRTQRSERTAAATAAAARRVRAHLAHAEVMTRGELDELIGADARRGVGLWVDLLRVPPAGTWERRRADRYALAEARLGPPGITEGAAVAHLVRRYLEGFGPAPARDVAAWAGLPVTRVAAALRRLELRRFRGPDGEDLVDLEGLPLPEPDTPVPVALLPTWDALLLAHARRTAVLPESYRPRIFSSHNPQSTPTFLVDGVVAGAWRARDGGVELEPFARLGRAGRRELEAAAERMAAFCA